MAKSIDYSKIKAMASSILECIGDDEEGKDPSIPAQKQDINDGGQDEPLALLPKDEGDAEEGETISDSEDATDMSQEEEKKKKVSMLANMFSSKFSK